MKISGSAGLFNKKKFTSSGAQRWAEREMGNTKKNTATLTNDGMSVTWTIFFVCKKHTGCHGDQTTGRQGQLTSKFRSRLAAKLAASLYYMFYFIIHVLIL